MGCHFLLQCMKVKSESEAAQSYPTLSDPMDCSLPGSFIHGIFQARVLEWGAIAFSSYSDQGTIKPGLYSDSTAYKLSNSEPLAESLCASILHLQNSNNTYLKGYCEALVNYLVSRKVHTEREGL